MHTPEPLNVVQARNQLAALYGRRKNNGYVDPDAEAAARAKLATAKIDVAIRDADAGAKGARLNEVQVSHLCALILLNAGVPGEALQYIEPVLRTAVRQAQNGSE
jgi:hypothetical protein